MSLALPMAGNVAFRAGTLTSRRHPVGALTPLPKM